MNYTSGTTGRPKGVRRALAPIDPDLMRSLFAMLPRACSASSPRRTTSTCAARRSTTRPCSCSPARSLHFGHTRRADGQVDARGSACADREATASRPATWCRRSSTACWRCPRTCKRRYDVSSLRAHDPRRGALPGRREAPHDRVVGPGDLRVLRRDRGRRHAGRRPRSGSSIPAPSAAPGRAPRSTSSTTPATSCRPAQPGTVYMTLGAARLRVPQGRRRRPTANRRDELLHGRRRRLPRRGRATCSSATARST